MPLLLSGLLFIGMPILELAVLITVGGRIGILPTIGIVLLSAVVGAMLLKRQGFAALGRMRAEAQAGRVPGREMVQTVMIVVAGILLVLPGLIGDAIGLLLFLPPVRDLLWRALGRNVTVVVARPRGAPGWRAGPGAVRPARPDIVDLSGDDFRRKGGNPGSPWSNGDEDGTGPDRTLH